MKITFTKIMGCSVIIYLLIAMTVFMSGCLEPEPPKGIDGGTVGLDGTSQITSNRISVTRIGTFEDSLAYRGWRGVYLIRDNKTEQEWIGISGVGVSEMGSHSAGKNTIQDER